MWWCIIDGRLTRDLLTHTVHPHRNLLQEERSGWFCRRAPFVVTGCEAPLECVSGGSESARIPETVTFFSCSLLILSLPLSIIIPLARLPLPAPRGSSCHFREWQLSFVAVWAEKEGEDGDGGEDEEGFDENRGRDVFIIEKRRSTVPQT